MTLFPLENNPDVLNQYIKRLGVERPMLHFVDVYGVSEELLSMLPGQAFAVLLVYPITPKSESTLWKLTKEQEQEVEKLMKSTPIFYMKQVVENSCGTVALLHALLNNYDSIGEVKEGSLLAELHNESQHFEVRGRANKIGSLVKDNSLLAAAHTETAFKGDTENQPIDARIDLHFSCFAWAWDRCVELDGRKEQPILHGACHSRDEFLQETAKAIQERMSLHTNLHSYSITALVPIPM